MVFSSILFLFIFLPLVLAFYYICPSKGKNLVLLIFSLIFYAWGEPKYIFIMLFSSVLDYTVAIAIDKYRGLVWSKIALLVSIFANLGMLFFFKYTDFFIEVGNNVFGCNIPILGLALPIGISFYTFQTMSYSIDVYRGNAPVQKNILSLATYVTLFPQLVAGPIVRYKDVSEQINYREHTIEKFEDGVYRFALGLCKKVLIANNVGFIWSEVKLLNFNTISLGTAWLGIISFAIQIYFDFSGYSDMAIGLGKMFGFDFLENFNYPYISMSITEFWRRWHMSLGQWFRDYVYIPLGGNRVSKQRWVLNIMIVWLLTGFWHGADFNFMIWGLYFGIILLFEKIYFYKILEDTCSFLRHLYVIILVLISWAIFEIPSIAQLLLYLKSMFINNNIIDEVFIYFIVPNLFLLLFSIVSCTPIFEKYIKSRFLKKILVMIGFFLSIVYLLESSFNPFLYFRF